MKKSATHFQAGEYPSIRIAEAMAHGNTKKFLWVVAGGLGDRVCAEPTLRYAQDAYKGCEHSLMCDTPEVFRHLKFKHIFTDTKDIPDKQFLPVHTYGMGLANTFFNPNLMHSVDFASVSAIRGQLPPSYRAPYLEPIQPVDMPFRRLITSPNTVAIHLGKSWPSRTIPSWWYEKAIERAVKIGWAPLIFGKDCVQIDDLVAKNCFDLRDKLSIYDYIWMLQHVEAVITNDSSPLHIAATGRAKIAYIPTCRPPWFLQHNRQMGSGLGWRMKDFFQNPMWDEFTYEPNDLSPRNLSRPPEGRTIDEYIPTSPDDLLEWIRYCP